MKNLKLDKLSSNRFDEKELSKIRGGELCSCVCLCNCRYADVGGSSTNNSLYENSDTALTYNFYDGNEIEA